MKNQIETGANIAICQRWVEHEHGWGNRPDGFSLHLSVEGLLRYIKDYWDSMPKKMPAEFSAPAGTPYEVGVGDGVVEELKLAGDGLRFYTDYGYPGSGKDVQRVCVDRLIQV